MPLWQPLQNSLRKKSVEGGVWGEFVRMEGEVWGIMKLDSSFVFPSLLQKRKSQNIQGAMSNKVPSE